MKILMVCLGNICRSPLAEGILVKKIKDNNLDWQVDSAGTSGWHEGEPPHNGSIDVAFQNGINIQNQKSRQFSKDDFDSFDLIIAMDSSNFTDISNMTNQKKHLDKIKLLLNYSHPGSNMAVPDPYYSGGFEKVYNLIDFACDALIAEFKG